MKNLVKTVLTVLLSILFYASSAETIQLGDTVTHNTDYSMNKDLTVYGVLIVKGTFTMGSQATLTLGNNATIIVSGDFIAANQVNISSGGIFIIGGSLTIKGDAKGSFEYTGEGKAQVYIGGSVEVKDGNGDDYPVLIEGTGSHDSSGHNYGDITDLSNEQADVFEEYKDIICGSGITPGSIISQSTHFCETGDPLEILEDLPASSSVSYQWYYSTNSTDPDVASWTAISNSNSKTYDPDPITQSTHYYREVKKGNGCTAKSNSVSIMVYPKPQPRGIFHD